MLKIVLILGCLLIVSLLLHETDLNRINKWHNWIGLRARAECCLLLTAAIHFHACIYTAKRLNYIRIFDILHSKLFPSTPCANFTCKLTALGCKREIWKNELKNCYFDVFAGLLLLQVSNAAFIGPSVKADTDRWTWTSNISHIDNRSTDTNMQCVLYAGKTRTTVSFGLLKWHWKRWSRSSVAGKKILLVQILFLFGERYPGF